VKVVFAACVSWLGGDHAVPPSVERLNITGSGAPLRPTLRKDTQHA
jgi:hypothetical protein